MQQCGISGFHTTCYVFIAHSNKISPPLNNPQFKKVKSIFKSSSKVHRLKVERASASEPVLTQHLQSAETQRELTHSLCQAEDLLIVGVCFIPDEGVGKVGEGWERLLELTAHDGHHQVDLHQAKGETVLGQEHLQNRLVASCPGAQVDQVEVTAGYGHLLMKNL